jgi:hypothetical protein
MQFWFVSVVTKLLNSDAFSNHLFPIFMFYCSPVLSFNADRIAMSRRALPICVKALWCHNAVSTVTVTLFLLDTTAIELTYVHDKCLIHKQQHANNLCLWNSFN